MRSDHVLPRIDLWAAVPEDDLPPDLVHAFERKDWVAVKDHLRRIMDALMTDGVYGRELLNLVLKLPVGIDPLFDRYRAMASIDFGDWDGLQQCLDARPNDPAEIEGLRDIVLAPVSETGIPRWTERHHKVYFDAYNYQFAQLSRGFRRWAEEIQQFRPIAIWSRGDMPVKRHVRYRQLHDAVSMAVAESVAGRLPVAVSFALEAQHLGDEGEPARSLAADVERLAAAAMGDAIPEHVETWEMITRPTGMSPLGAWQFASNLLPLVAAISHPSLEWGAQLAEHAAAGLGSPRAHLHAEAWKVGAKLILGTDKSPRELPALLVQARRAGPGLRVLPQLLKAHTTHRPEEFLEAERLARRVGNVWAQVSALVWAVALSPTHRDARSLHRLLLTTGWRRPILVPPEVVADAALGMVSVGIRGRAVVEMAAIAGRPNVTVEVARRHLDEADVPLEDKQHALDALAALGTTNALEILKRLSGGRDELAKKAAILLAKPSRPLGLSERELEVLHLAGEGLTNRGIGSRLRLSPHTVARHLANARGRMGAANRAEAAALLAASGR